MLKLLLPRGRLGRANYALATLALLPLLAATVFVPELGWVRVDISGGGTHWSPGLGLLPAAVLLWPLACLQINRLRDFGASSWWALLPVAILAVAAAVIQLTDGLDLVLLGWLKGSEVMRSQMVWTFPKSHAAMAWAVLAWLGCIGWLVVAPPRRAEVVPEP